MSNNQPMRTISAYDKGRSADYACQFDKRFSYCSYVPESALITQPTPNRLLVVIHGSGRNNQSLRDRFIPFAERHGYVVLSPLFPCGITHPDDRDSYKYLKTQAVQYDQVLISMIKELSDRLSMNFNDYFLFGFSGGAQFVHRFFYLHPQHINALYIASPGSVTLLDDTQNWWVGTQDVNQHFATHNIDYAALRKPPIQLAVGENDLHTLEITHKPGGDYWMENANHAGKTRVERCHTLFNNYLKHDLNVSFTVIPDIAHDGEVICNHAMGYFSTLLGAADL